MHILYITSMAAADASDPISAAAFPKDAAKMGYYAACGRMIDLW